MNHDKIDQGLATAASWIIFELSKDETPSVERVEEILYDHLSTWVQRGGLEEAYDKVISEEKEKKDDCVPAPTDIDLENPEDQEKAADKISKEHNVNKKTAWTIIKALLKLGWQNRRLIGSVLSLLFENHAQGLKSIKISEKELLKILLEETNQHLKSKQTH